MAPLTVGLLHKLRGNFAIQQKYAGSENVVDETDAEVDHHEGALVQAGYRVRRLRWGSGIINDLQLAEVDLVFNVSSLVEAAILEELQIPFVGSGTAAISVTTDKGLAKRLWQQTGLPTSPFRVLAAEDDCEAFRENPPFPYPLFIKPVAGRGSAGIDATSVVGDYDQLVEGVRRRLDTIGQPVLVERFLKGREITLGVLGNESARVLPPLEIEYRAGDITLGYDKKMMDDDTFLCPALLETEQTAALQRLALQAYHSLGMRDFGHIDTILTQEGPFLLEANSFAGLMCTPKERPHSYIGFMARAEGLDGKDLIGEIVTIARRRHARSP